MDNYSVKKLLEDTWLRVPVKVQVDNKLFDIEDIVWTGLENEGCYKIILKEN